MLDSPTIHYLVNIKSKIFVHIAEKEAYDDGNPCIRCILLFEETEFKVFRDKKGYISANASLHKFFPFLSIHFLNTEKRFRI